MKTIDFSDVDPRVAHKILAYLNRADTVTDITDGLIEDDPETGSGGYVIGEVVANRILKRRDELPHDRFTSIYQLEGIQGLGPDKLQDLVFSLSKPDAEIFRELMYLDVITENWDLRHHTFNISNQAEFYELVSDARYFKYWVARQVGRIARIKYGKWGLRREAKRRIRHTLLEIYEDTHLASYAWGLWFYKFDVDNWFNFEDVRKVIEDSLAYYVAPSDRIELRLLKGFQNQGLLTEHISAVDLPVWINFAEQSITIWTAELRD